ncbi:MAG TPA: secretin N-terminal domain-containing protein [Thermoanaerobaculia bacterium]|nr:secretin N-terminal domain-containing protein [Thermoanaerobaculia bacterium]
MIVLITVALLLGAAPGVLADAPESERIAARTFQLKFRDASRAALVIKPLISASGSVSIQPSSNTLVVTDEPEVLREVARTMARYDAPPRSFEVELKLVAASRAASPAPVPEDLREVSSKLSGVLRFNSFEKLGGIAAEGNEGDPVVVNLDGAFRAEFRMNEFDPVSQSLQLGEFRLLRIPAEGGELQQLLKTATLNLRIGQTVVLGASRLPNSNRALMLVLVARPVE